MFHLMRCVIRDKVLLSLVFAGSMFLGTSATAAQVPTTAVGTITGTASSIVDQTIVGGLVVSETEVPISDGRIAIPELGIDMPLAADGTFNFSNLLASEDPDSPTEVTVVFTAPGLGSYTYLHLRIGPRSRPNLTPVLTDSPRVNDPTIHHGQDASTVSPMDLSLAQAPTDQPAPASGQAGQLCGPSVEILVLPKTIRVWENGPGQDGLVRTYDFQFYVKHSLAREWFPFWDDDALWAGAMAVKSFAWFHASHGLPLHEHVDPDAPECYDVDAAHQRFDPDFDDPDTDAAVEATWGFYMIEGSGLGADVVQAFYKRGLNDACEQWNGGPAPGNDMSQYGSQACAQDGFLWFVILVKYYFPPAVSWLLPHASGDNDNDGCTSGREVGNNEFAGGRRSPIYFWDYFDTWTNSTGPWIKDKVINIPDILAWRAASVPAPGRARQPPSPRR